MLKRTTTLVKNVARYNAILKIYLYFSISCYSEVKAISYINKTTVLSLKEGVILLQLLIFVYEQKLVTCKIISKKAICARDRLEELYKPHKYQKR